MWTLVPNCQFENFFSAYFCIEFEQKNFCILPRKLIKYSSYFLIEAVLYIIAVVLTWGMHIQNSNIAPVTS
jgi:hypothetical protein